MWNTCWLAKSLSIGYTVFWHPTQVSFIGNWNFYGKKRKLVNWKNESTARGLGLGSCTASRVLRKIAAIHFLQLNANYGRVGSGGQGVRKRLWEAHRIAVAWQGAKILPQQIPQLKHHKLSHGWERTMKILELGYNFEPLPKTLSELFLQPPFFLTGKWQKNNSRRLQSVWELPK